MGVTIPDMRILAIETSCDETAIAVLLCTEKRIHVTKSLVSSQVPIHMKYGGVVPEVAAREHVPETVHLIREALGKQGMRTFDAIAVTNGPGLPTALSVGVEAAKALAYLSGKPLIGVNHLEGHLASAWLNTANRKRWQFPLLALVVSGGHTEIVLMKNFGNYTIIGETRDDAAGECFDKCAKLIGLPYPGGPQIARLAVSGKRDACVLPRPMLDQKNLDMSFSGLKTAVRQAWETGVWKDRQEDFCASIEQAIVDVLVEKTMQAVAAHHPKGVLLVGGVSANTYLRDSLGERLTRDASGAAFLPSDRAYITDNAAMIAAAGYWNIQRGKKTNWKKIDVRPDWRLGTL